MQSQGLRFALKEWAVTTEAMNEGQQVLLLRKGGIREEAKEFQLLHPRFLLYPSYEHQQASLLKPEFHAALERTLARRPPEGTLAITHWGEVTESFDVMDQEKIDDLAHLYIWTTDYAAKRLHWKPRKPLMVMLVRLYRLPEPRTIAVLPEYSGCKSWVELADAIDVSGSTPVISDEDYQRQVEAVHQTLGVVQAQH